jgi:hypothetical protein
MQKKRAFALIALAFVLTLAAFLVTVQLVRAFNGPPSGCTPPNCQGAVGVNSSNNLSVGTTTPLANTKFLIVASDTSASNYSLKILQPATTPIFVVENGGLVGIATTSPAYQLDVVGTVRATTFLGNYSGTLTANNVTNGVFGSCGSCGGGIYSFPSSLGVATSTNGSLPATLSVYGGGYFSGNVGVGTSAPDGTLTVSGNGGIGLTGSGGELISLVGTNVTPYIQIRNSNGKGIIFGMPNGDPPTIEVYNGAATTSVMNFSTANPGYVGIGTSSPANALSVSNGSIQIAKSGAGLIFPDGTTQVTAATSLSPHIQVFTANGTWTYPSGVNEVWVTMCGGGGGGGGGGGTGNGATLPGGGGAGGGGGDCIFRYPVAVSGNVSVTVGAGGAGGAGEVNSTGGAGGAGTGGSASIFGSLWAFGGGGGGGGYAGYGGTNAGGQGGSAGYGSSGYGGGYGGVGGGSVGNGGSANGGYGTYSGAGGGGGGGGQGNGGGGGLGGGGGVGGPGGAEYGYGSNAGGGGGGGGGGNAGGFGGAGSSNAAGGNGGTNGLYGFGGGGAGGAGAASTGSNGFNGGNGANGGVIVEWWQ